ncbi:hypothetical protein V3390_09355 [Luteimonas sp. FXH3W]|uniref:Uncharacterized protein n=1 Tax=Aquilutibacter rugosus TaxID=3115820 RepID=A0ABU7V2W7_9GAMM
MNAILPLPESLDTARCLLSATIQLAEKLSRTDTSLYPLLDSLIEAADRFNETHPISET